MLKHTALIAIPVAAAQNAGGGPGRPGPLQRFMQHARLRIERGVRAGRITPEELSRLRADAESLRARAQAMRQTGAPPAPADRRQLRQSVRKLNREIFVANHNRIRR